MLSNAYLLAKIGADTAENEQRFAKILPTDALWRLSEVGRVQAVAVVLTDLTPHGVTAQSLGLFKYAIVTRRRWGIFQATNLLTLFASNFGKMHHISVFLFFQITLIFAVLDVVQFLQSSCIFGRKIARRLSRTAKPL